MLTPELEARARELLAIYEERAKNPYNDLAREIVGELRDLLGIKPEPPGPRGLFQINTRSVPMGSDAFDLRANLEMGLRYVAGRYSGRWSGRPEGWYGRR